LSKVISTVSSSFYYYTCFHESKLYLCSGFYSAIFAATLCIHHQRLKEDITSRVNKSLLYPLYVLYILSTATFAVDVAATVMGTGFFRFMNPTVSIGVNFGELEALSIAKMLPLYWISTITTGLCDFIAQSILIHRCWIVWGGKIRIIIIPSILAIMFLATWLAAIEPKSKLPRDTGASERAHLFIVHVRWKYMINLISIALSLTVNAIVTGLITLKIVKVYRDVRPSLEENLSISGGSKLRPIIFVMIESGMVLFAIQLFRFCITITQGTSFRFIIGIHQMSNGIIPTSILLRKLSYTEEKYSGETISTLRFQVESVNQDPIPVGQERIWENGVQIESTDM